MSEDRFIIDTMLWSFSRLNSYHQCPYGFWLKYVQCNKGTPNFFGQYGSLIHEILEKYVKQELSIFEISQYYEENFNKKVTCNAPYNKYSDIRQSYYDRGLEYLDNIDLLLDSYDVLGIEKEVKFTIGKYEMIGYIDLLLRDKGDKKIIVLDHKSADIKFKKNGELSQSKPNIAHVLDFKRQLYLYSMAVINEYNEKPKQLQWNLFNSRRQLIINFNEADYKAALAWAEETVKQIEDECMWLPNPEWYWCHNICDMRENACEYKPN